MEEAGLRVEATHTHPLQDWRDCFAPMRRTAERTRSEGDAAFADEVLASVEEEWRVAQTSLDYVTVVARRE